MLRSGSSYLSASELVLTFGLAQREKADTIEIRWPSGLVDRLSSVAAGQTATVTEGKGITSSRPTKRRNEPCFAGRLAAVARCYRASAEKTFPAK